MKLLFLLSLTWLVACSANVSKEIHPAQHRKNPIQPTNPETRKPENNPKPINPARPPLIPVASDDEVYYYGGDLQNRVSVRISAWREGERTITLYDPFGHITFIQKDIRKSFSETSSLRKFHPNGALALLQIRMNPGASLYWHESRVTFNIHNEPEWKITLKRPAKPGDHLDNRLYWDKQRRAWSKQENFQKKMTKQQ